VMRILPRGNWLDDSGEAVQPDVPAFLGSLNGTEKNAHKPRRARAPRTLTISHISPHTPLIARLFLHRLWEFALAQVVEKSLEDFGSQGAAPSHPELLDWLATEFIARGWDVKAMLKMMVMSSSYRQASVATKEMRERDPGNQWLARQNRFRLDAEMVRDAA